MTKFTKLCLLIPALAWTPSYAGLTNCWTFDKGPDDECGGVIGTPFGDAQHVETPWGRGYDFGGNGYILTDLVPAYGPEASFTFAVRFKSPATAPSTTMDLFGFEVTNRQEIRLTVRGDLGNLTWSVRDDDWTHSQSFDARDLRDDTWHWAVVQRDGVAQRLRVYIDGALICERSSPTGEINLTNQQVLAIGANRHNGISDHYVGIIDELRIYDHALTHPEVLTLSLADLTNYWPFDGSFDDFVGGILGTPIGDPEIIETPWGSGLSVDGDDAIMTELAPVVEPGGSISVACWVWIPADVSDVHAVFGLERTNAQELRIVQRADLGGFCRFSARDDDGMPAFADTDPDLRGTGWRHLVGVKDGDSGEVRAYLDGVSVDDDDAAPGPINVTAPISLAIGANNNSTFGLQEFFIGKIDELRFFDRALSDDEVAAFVIGEPCPADLNCSGAVDIADLLLVLSNYGSTIKGALGDADLDGDADFADVLVVLTAWGSCP